MTIANLIVNVATNHAELMQGVGKIQGQLDQVETMASKVRTALTQAFTVTAIVTAINRVGAWAGEIDDLSKRLGISREAVQRLTFAATQNGTTIDAVTRSVEFLQRALLSGDKGAVSAVDKLGLNLNVIKAQSADQLMLSIAQAMARIHDPAERNALAFELMGQRGAELLQMFPTLAADMDRAMAAGDALVESGDKLGDTFDHLTGSGSAILAYVLVPLEKSLGLIAGVMNGVNGAWQRFRALTESDRLKETAESAKLAEAAYVGMRTHGIEPIAMSMAQADEIAREMDATLKRQNDTLKKHQQAVAAAEAKTAEWRDEVAEASNGLVFMLAKLRVMPGALENMNASTQVLASSTLDLKAAMIGASQAFNIVSQGVSSTIPQIERTRGVFGSLFESVQTGMQDIWKGMSGEKGFPGLMSNLGGSIVQGFGDILSGGLSSVINMGVQMALAGAKKLASIIGGLFQSEETKKVSSPRDQFFQQFIDKGFGSTPFEALAAAFTSVGGGDVAESMIKMLYDADTASKWNTAQSTVADFFRNRGLPIQSFATGSGGFRDFGGGTLAMLHGRERVVTESEGRGESRAWEALSARFDDLLRVLPDAMENAARYGAQTAGRRG